MVRTIGFILFVFLPLALAGCGGPAPANNMISDAELGNVADPAITGAIQDPIMVDPQLGAQANGDAVRPPSQPYSGGVPDDAVAANGEKMNTAGLMKAPAPVAGKDCPQCKAAREAVTLGGLAARQPNARIKGCAGALQYSARWAQRLPADLPLYPQARVTEAAGAQGGNCALRVVSFSAAQPVDALLDWYYTRARRAGYTAEHQVDGAQHILGGTRTRDDGAYVLFLTRRRDGGTDMDLVVNNGI
ncbi:hypothetical protein MZO42_15520 [Sphingomonas psychrotolerans]|uniref:Uncharacterized protein n=1 Tax=Sphingomonas psychrotolerans TaxID=1327635 RepID=A0ABU3N6F5_9SPHN|nr:hypothetical protein [Sphingomonas psychrotolerans]MDT8760109.1 hypothetical protein [Sphingomonas psychrotolerans]